MSRLLNIYPADRTEAEMLQSNTVFLFTRLYCDQAGGEFYRQCGVYGDDPDDEGMPKVIFRKPIPTTVDIVMAEEDVEGINWLEDQDGRLQYCLARDFHKIHPDKTDTVINDAVLTYVMTLPADQVIVFRIT